MNATQQHCRDLGNYTRSAKLLRKTYVLGLKNPRLFKIIQLNECICAVISYRACSEKISTIFYAELQQF